MSLNWFWHRYKWNVSFVLEYPNRTLSRGGSVASVGCDADGGGRASFTTEVNAAGVYVRSYCFFPFPCFSLSFHSVWLNACFQALHAYVSYLFPQEGHNCSDGGTFDNQTEVPYFSTRKIALSLINILQVVTTNFLVQNTPIQSGLASSVVTTTLSLPVAPTGHVQGSSGSSGQSIISTVSLERLGLVWIVLAIGMMMMTTIWAQSSH